jgi:osmotically-inducible protein OsmY
MNRRTLAVTLLASLAAVALAFTGTAQATGGATADPSPSPSATGDKSGVEKAGKKVEHGAEKTGEAVGHAAKETGEAVGHAGKETGEAVGHAAKDTGHAVKKGAQKTGDAVDATKQHLDVHDALHGDKTIDASHIDIDTDKDHKILYLRGTVPTAAQKARAEAIARDKADGFTVRNELTVMAVPPKK